MPLELVLQYIIGQLLFALTTEIEGADIKACAKSTFESVAVAVYIEPFAAIEY